MIEKLKIGRIKINRYNYVKSDLLKLVIVSYNNPFCFKYTPIEWLDLANIPLNLYSFCVKNKYSLCFTNKEKINFVFNQADVKEHETELWEFINEYYEKI